jgi:hypothetical protein
VHLVPDLFDSFGGHGAVGRDHSNEHHYGESVTQRGCPGKITQAR